MQLGLHRTDNPLFNVPGLYDWATMLEAGGNCLNMTAYLLAEKVSPEFSLLSESFSTESIFLAGGTVLALINRVYGKLPSIPLLQRYKEISEVKLRIRTEISLLHPSCC